MNRGETSTIPSVTAEEVHTELNRILDPCSCTAGAPAGLADMGLVRQVTVTEGPEGAHVYVRLTLTEPTCWMGFAFVTSAREHVEALPGVTHADVEIGDCGTWSEDDLQPAYRQMLSARRQRVSAELGLPRTREGGIDASHQETGQHASRAGHNGHRPPDKAPDRGGSRDGTLIT